MDIMEQLLFEYVDKHIDEPPVITNLVANIGDILDIILFFNRNKYLKSICLTNKKLEEESYASFSPTTKDIHVYFNEIIKRVNNSLKESNCDNREVMCMLYFDFLQFLLHEVEHSKQYALMESRFKNSLEKNILNMTVFNSEKILVKNVTNRFYKKYGRKPNESELDKCCMKLLKEWFELYKKYYSLTPMERLADFSASVSLEKMFEGKDEYKFYFDLAQMYSLSTLVYGYEIENDFVISPTITFIEKLQNSHFRKPIVFDWYSKDRRKCLENVKSVVSRFDRIKYGLPLTLDEFKDIEEKSKKQQEYMEKTYSLKIKDERPKIKY